MLPTNIKNKIMKNVYNQKGFSLIELIVVVAVIAIISGTIIPVYNSMRPKIRLNGAAREVQGDLLWAKMQAITQNNRFRVFFFKETCGEPDHQGFNSTDHTYQILDDDNNNNSEDAGEEVITKHIQTSCLDVTGTSTADPIFYPRGNAWPVNTDITLFNSSGNSTVTVNIAGRITIE